VAVDTPVSIAIAIAMTVGMTIGTIFVCPVRLDICQRPLDVEKHISLLRPDSRESSRCHFVISSLLLTSFNLQTGERGQTYLYHHHSATIPLNSEHPPNNVRYPISPRVSRLRKGHNGIQNLVNLVISPRYMVAYLGPRGIRRELRS